jgi:hypothetical protein
MDVGRRNLARQFPLIFVGALLLGLPATARAQGQAPRDPYLAALERREAIVQAKRFHALFDRHPRRPKPSGCATGRICSDRRGGIQSQRIPGTGLVAVLHDVDAEEDGLVVRMRFYNDGSEPVRLRVDPTQAGDAYSIEVGGERRFILRNDDGALEAKEPVVRVLAPGSMESWWAKFPPLERGAKSLDISIPPAPRFESIAASDF